MGKLIDRRKFIKSAGLLAVGATIDLPKLSFAKQGGLNNIPDLAVAKGGTASERVAIALKMLGGINRWVKPGDTVVVKPNIGWDRRPEQAADTNPEVVAAVVAQCINTGAKRVMVFDRTCNNAKRCYHNSGIAEAAEKAGAIVPYTIEAGFKYYDMPENKYLKGWSLYRPAMEADCLINVPIAKHHSLAGLTLGMKNLMGIMGDDRGKIHWNIHKYLPELAAFIKPQLTIIDATRILIANGPQGGNPKDIKQLDTIIASPFIASADAFATTLFGKKPQDIGYIVNSVNYNLGEIDIDKINYQVERI